MPPARFGRTYFNFIASHDGIGVRPAEGLLTDEELHTFLSAMKDFGGSVSHHRRPDGVDKPYEINISLWDAMRGTLHQADEHQFARFICAHTILLGLEGLPAFYIHSLIATENAVDLRAQTGRARSINRRQWDLDELSQRLTDETLHHGHVLTELKKRINLRKTQPALHPNATQYTLHLGDQIFGFWRESIDRKQNIFAIHNITTTPQELNLGTLNLIGTETWRDLISGEEYHDLEGNIHLPPYGCIWVSNSR